MDIASGSNTRIQCILSHSQQCCKQINGPIEMDWKTALGPSESLELCYKFWSFLSVKRIIQDMFIGWQVVIEKSPGLLPQSVSCSYNLVLKHQTVGCSTSLFYTVYGVAERAEPRAQSEGSEQVFVFWFFCNILKNFQIAADTAPFLVASYFVASVLSSIIILTHPEPFPACS